LQRASEPILEEGLTRHPPIPPFVCTRALTLDDEPVRSLAKGDPAGFIAGLKAGTVIDEAQRAPDLLLAIKSRVDRDDTPGQFLLTGSAISGGSRRSQTHFPVEPTT